MHPELVTETVYDPDVVTVMDLLLEPFDQRLPLLTFDVSVTLPPWQKDKGPLAVMIGAVPFTVTVVAADVLDGQVPFDTDTV
mgnify:FL=1